MTQIKLFNEFFNVLKLKFENNRYNQENKKTTVFIIFSHLQNFTGLSIL